MLRVATVVATLFLGTLSCAPAPARPTAVEPAPGSSPTAPAAAPPLAPGRIAWDSHVFGIVTGPEDVYALTSKSRILRIERTTGQLEAMATAAGVSVLAATTTHLYWGTFEGEVFRRDRRGAGDERIGESVPMVHSLRADEAYLYGVHTGDAEYPPTGALVRYGLEPGSEPTILADGLAYPLDLQLDGDRAFVLTGADGAVWSVPLAGTAGPQRLFEGLANPRRIAVDDSHVYCTVGGPELGREEGAVVRIDKRTGTLEVLAGAEWGPVWLAVDREHVYWLSSPTGEVRRLGKSGGEIEVVVPADAGEHRRSLALDGPRLYYGVFGPPGALVVVSKDPPGTSQR